MSEEKHSMLSSEADEPQGDRVDIDSLIEFFDVEGNEFDPQIFVACNSYLSKHEAQRLAERRLLANEMIPPLEFKSFTRSEKIHSVLNEPFRTKFGKAYLAWQVVMIFISVAAVVVESLPEYNPVIFPDQEVAWTILDGLVSVYFLIEMIARIAVHPPPRRNAVFTWLTVIDILTILPFFIEVSIQPLADDRGVFGTFKAIRVLRLTKLMQHISSMHVMYLTMKKSFQALITPTIVTLVVALVFAAAIYYSERGTYDPSTKLWMAENCSCTVASAYVVNSTRSPCPMVESQFSSILHTMWLVIQTITTVGYGDQLPLCSMGQFLTVLAMMFGSLALSMPIAIVGSIYSALEFESRERIKQLRRSRSTLGSRSFGEPSLSLERTSSFLRSKMQPETDFLNEEVESAGISFLRHLSRQVKDRALLRTVSLYTPSKEISYFTDLYLHDFVEEIATLSSRDLRQTNEVAQLRPASASASTAEEFQVGILKERDRFLVSQYERIDEREPALTKFESDELARQLLQQRSSTDRARQLLSAFDTSESRSNQQVQHRPGVYCARIVGRFDVSYMNSDTDFGLRKEGSNVKGLSSAASGVSGSAVPRIPVVHVSFVDPFTSSLERHSVEPFADEDAPTISLHRSQALAKGWKIADDAASLRQVLEGSQWTLPQRAFVGSSVQLNGMEYRLLNDDSDLDRTMRSFRCAFEIALKSRRRSLANFSSTLTSTAESPGLRRRRGSPTHQGSIQANRKHTAHVTPDGELSMPFLSDRKANGGKII